MVAIPLFILIHPSANREPTVCALLPGIAIVGWMKMFKIHLSDSGLPGFHALRFQSESSLYIL